jgi:hypothetical protein
MSQMNITAPSKPISLKCGSLKSYIHFRIFDQNFVYILNPFHANNTSSPSHSLLFNHHKVKRTNYESPYFVVYSVLLLLSFCLVHIISSAPGITPSMYDPLRVRNRSLHSSKTSTTITVCV